MAPGHRKASASRVTKASASKKRPAAAKAKSPGKKKSAPRPAGTKVKWKADTRETAPEAPRPVETPAAPEPPRIPPPLPVPIATFVL
jgi:hypothetical protein